MKKGLIYILFVLAVLVGMLIVIIQNENKVVMTEEMQDEAYTVHLGRDIIDDYIAHKEDIKSKKYILNVFSKGNNSIAYKDQEELKKIIYEDENYTREEVKALGVTYSNYYIESYANLKISLARDAANIDEEKLSLYYDGQIPQIDSIHLDDDIEENMDENVDENMDEEELEEDEEIEEKEIELEDKSTTLKPDELLAGDLLLNFKAHEKDIKTGVKYFKVIIDKKSLSFNDYDKLFTELKKDKNKNEKYKKEYELTTRGELKGYTFTQVK